MLTVNWAYEKRNLEIHSSDFGGNPYRHSDNPRRDQLFRCVKFIPVTFGGCGDIYVIILNLFDNVFDYLHIVIIPFDINFKPTINPEMRAVHLPFF